MIYDLIAVDNHYGGLGGGHYTAYVKNWYDGKWYYCDGAFSAPQVYLDVQVLMDGWMTDASVREAQAYTVVTPAAYLLFYRRRSDKPLGGPKFEQIAAQHSPSVAEGGEEEDEMDVQQGSSPGISRENSPPLLGPILPRASYDSGFFSTSVGNALLWGHSLPAARLGPITTEDDGALPGYDDLDNPGGVQLASDEGLGNETENDIASDRYLAIPDNREGEEDEEKVDDVRV
jgi:ubiquitin carboxyl-terminal hydrolase 4/11/15